MLYLFFFSYIMCVCACMCVGQKTLGSLISSPRDLDQPEASVSPWWQTPFSTCRALFLAGLPSLNWFLLNCEESKDKG